MKNGYEKVQILKKRFVIEPLDHEKWIPHSNLHQNHSVSAKNIFLPKHSDFDVKLSEESIFHGSKAL